MIQQQKLPQLSGIMKKYLETSALHRDTPVLHKDTPALHRDTPALHRDTPALHRDTPALQRPPEGATIDSLISQMVKERSGSLAFSHQ